MIPKARQNSPKCNHVGSKNEAPEGYPIGFPAEIRWGTHPGVGFSILYHVEARFARLLCGKCGQDGSNLPSKIEPTSMKNVSKNRSQNRCILGSIFQRILMDFGKENRDKLVPKSMKNRYDLQKADFWKIIVFLQENHYFQGSGGPSWEPKYIKNLLKFEVQDRRALGIDFSRIFVSFGRQVGKENRAKID